MLKKDLILRQMEEFGKVLALILGFKKSGDWEKFEKEVAEAAQKFTTMEIGYVEQLDAGGFEKEVLNHKHLDLEQKKILANLLFEKLDLYAAQNNQAAYLRLREHCKVLYTHIRANFTENEFDLNVHYRLNFLNQAG